MVRMPVQSYRSNAPTEILSRASVVRLVICLRGNVSFRPALRKCAVVLGDCVWHAPFRRITQQPLAMQGCAALASFAELSPRSARRQPGTNRPG